MNDQKIYEIISGTDPQVIENALNEKSKDYFISVISFTVSPHISGLIYALLITVFPKNKK